MDHGSTKRIQDYVRQWPFLHDAAMHMARYGYLFYFLFGIVQWMRPGTYAEKTKRQRALLEAIFSVCYSSGFSFLLGCLWKRKRPFVAHRDIHSSISHTDNPSFPSNHTMNAVTASIAVAKRSPCIGVFLLLWGFLIGLSRVACGLHYVSDIIGGAIMAIPGNMAASQCHVVRFVSSIILALWDIKVSAKRF